MQSLQTVQPVQNASVKVNNLLATMKNENLPFTVRLVQNDDDLGKALYMRQSAYGRHVPELAKQLDKADQYDHEPGTVVLLAESKMDGEVLGTMRIQTNRHTPLALEQSVTLPDWLQGSLLAEATRLGVAHGHVGRLVKVALFKAYYQYCRDTGVDWMVIAGRSPLDRQYESLLFEDVFPEEGFIPMKHAGNIPHRVMALKIDSVEPTWKEAEHKLYDFFFHTRHNDIRVVSDQPADAGVAMETQHPQHLIN